MLNPATPPVSSSRRLSSTIRSAVRYPRWSPPRRSRGRGGVEVVSIVIQFRETAGVLRPVSAASADR
jgi:hypothetical protein